MRLIFLSCERMLVLSNPYFSLFLRIFARLHSAIFADTFTDIATQGDHHD